MREVSQLAKQLGIRVANPRLLTYTKDQSAFYASHFLLLSRDLSAHPHRLATTYFHGRPGSGEVEFDNAYRRFCAMHQHIDRVQVSHSEMRDVLLESGVAAEKLFVIPIAVNTSYFPFRTPERRREARQRLGVPDAAVVIGSFQKDGVGWEEGLQPKLTKGPDVFLETMTLLKGRVPGLFALLSGPARGFVKRGLERLGIPVQARVPRSLSGCGAVVSGVGSVSRDVTPGRRAQSRARVDGERRAPRDDARGAGDGPRAARAERVDGRAG